MPFQVDLTGRRFEKLIVVRILDERTPSGLVKWLCQCDCGNTVDVTTSNLKYGNTKSCGCSKIAAMASVGKANKTHGLSTDPIYYLWASMIQRCGNPQSSNYSDYGGRGIKVCDRWHVFENWYADIGFSRPDDSYSLERTNTNGNYEPGSCYWATMVEQNNNKRNNRLLTYKGETLTHSQASAKYGINRQTLRKRVDLGWDVNDVIEKQIRKENEHD